MITVEETICHCCCKISHKLARILTVRIRKMICRKDCGKHRFKHRTGSQRLGREKGIIIGEQSNTTSHDTKFKTHDIWIEGIRYAVRWSAWARRKKLKSYAFL